MRRRLLLLIVVMAALIAAGFEAADYQRGAALVIDAAGIHGWPERIADVNDRQVSIVPADVPTRHGAIAARLHRPSGDITRAVILVPGVHASGIEEPRLVGFAHDLTERGLAVATVDLPDLKRYAITPRTTDMIEDATLWLSGRAELTAGRAVGIIGISFSGGLAVVAAGRPSLGDKVAFVVSFGGHGDLPRTLSYLCTGRQQDGSFLPPHDYGVVIVLLGVADRVVPAGQVQMLRDAIRVFLEASHADMVDKRRAAELFAEARAATARMPEPAATLMRYVNARDVKALGPLLLPHVSSMGADPALSPARSPAPRAPVFLLHGTNDNVIPASESSLLADHFRGKTETRVLLTRLITHAEVDRPPDVAEVWKLISFWTDVLDE